MQWSELDLKTATWTLPRPRTKTKQPHVVGLPDGARAPRTSPHGAGEQEKHVFPGLTLTCDGHTALSMIHDGAYEWKDLRRTVATRLADLGFDETVIGRVSTTRSTPSPAGLQPAPLPRRIIRALTGVGRRDSTRPAPRAEDHGRGAAHARPLMPRRKPTVLTFTGAKATARAANVGR